MIRMTAMVSSMVRCLLRARPRAHLRARPCPSNGCATRRRSRWRRRADLLVAAIAVLGTVGATAEAAAAKWPESQPATHSVQTTASSVGSFLLGAGSALAAHEGGHLLFDGIFDAHPGVQKVTFHGLPFFAITHDPGLSDRKEIGRAHVCTPAT